MPKQAPDAGHQQPSGGQQPAYDAVAEQAAQDALDREWAEQLRKAEALEAANARARTEGQAGANAQAEVAKKQEQKLQQDEQARLALMKEEALRKQQQQQAQQEAQRWQAHQRQAQQQAQANAPSQYETFAPPEQLAPPSHNPAGSLVIAPANRHTKDIGMATLEAEDATKDALTALRFEDVPTAVAKLSKALALLLHHR